MKNRERQRANRRVKEEMLDRRDSFGIRDPTPFEAVKKLIRRGDNRIISIQEVRA